MDRQGRKFLFASITFGLMLTLCLVLVLFRPSRLEPLPNPNGYDDFVRAGYLVVGDLSTATGLSRDSLHSLVSSNSEPLRLLQLGLTRQCSFPTTSALTNFTMMATNLSALRSLAQLLRAEGNLAEMDQRPFEAAKAYIDAMRLGNEISRGGFILNRLVGIAIESIGATPLSRLVSQLGSENARPLLAQLEQLDAHRVSFEQIRHNESRYLWHELAAEKNPVKWVAGWWQGRGLVEHTEWRHKAVVAHERLLTTEIALRCFQSRTGHPARVLAELTNYLAAVPLDPFSSRPFVYRPSGTNWVLYSIGPDGTDDGGVPVSKGATTKGDIFYDSPW